MVFTRKSYKVGMRFSGHQASKLEKKANILVRRHQEIVQSKITRDNSSMVDHAYDLIDNNSRVSGTHGTHGARYLAKIIADGSNIGQVACTYVLSAVKGAIDREKKLGNFLELLEKHPKEAVCWIVFQRTPFLETSMSRLLGVDFEYSRHLILAAARNLRSNYVDVVLPKLEQIDFSIALGEFLKEIQDRIEVMRSQKRDLKNIEKFLRKLEFLKKDLDFMSNCLYHWLNFERANPVNSRWKSLKKLSREFALMLGYKRQRRLFSAIRGVVVHALSSQLDATVKNICETIKLRDLVAKPYKKQRKKLAALNLIMGAKYVITRPGNGKLLTQLALKDRRFTLGIRNADKRGEIIDGDVMIHHRLWRMIEKGASITSLSIRAGDAPARKLIVTIHLEGEEEMFISTDFIAEYPDLHLVQSDVIGLDVNRVSPHILVFSQKLELPAVLSTICNRYTELGEVISKLSYVLSKRKSGVKLQGELNRVYTRRKRLLKEIKHHCKMLSAAVLHQTKARQFNVEDLRFSSRGKHGALAKAILNMPDEIGIFEKAVILASKHGNRKIKLKKVKAFNTSSVHYNCGGRLRRNLENWDLCRCSICKVEVNTHFNAALHIRDGGVVA